MPHFSDFGESPPSLPSFDFQLREAQSGSAEAVGRLLNGFRETLQRLAEVLVDSKLRPKVGASDIVQDTLVDAERSLQSFQGQSATRFEAWLKQILVNNVISEFRKWRSTRKRQLSREISIDFSNVSAEMVDQGASPSSLIAKDELKTALHKALKQLTAEHQATIRMRHFEDPSFSEIGRQLDRSEDAARKLWYRAFDKLARMLEGHA